MTPEKIDLRSPSERWDDFKENCPDKDADAAEAMWDIADYLSDAYDRAIVQRDTMAAHIIAQNEQIAQLENRVKTARECIGYFADNDNWLHDRELDPNSGNFTGTILARNALTLTQPTPTTPRTDAATEE